MIHLFLFFLSLKIFAIPDALIARHELLDTHEFYTDNELIEKPLEAWQTIATFSSINLDLSLSKVCLKYFLENRENGILRIERTSLKGKCEDQGDVLSEMKNIRGLQFQRTPHFKITFTHQDFTTSEWNLPLQKKMEVKLLDTPDKYLGGTILFINEGEEKESLLGDKVQCLKVMDDCSVVGKPRCDQCQNGFLEAPNGCAVGPHYCLSGQCGVRGSPACRRGVKFLKKRVLDCRSDMSFAFCLPGTTPICQGQEVWCH